MRWTKSFAMAVLLFGPCCFGQAPPNATTGKPTTSNPVFSITIDPPASPIRLGSPINVTVTMTNIGGEEIYLASDKGPKAKYMGLTFLLMKSGREIETTVLHRKISGRQRPDDPEEVEHGSSIVLSYPPGTIFARTIDLKQLYQITQPGLYTLDVSRFDDYSKTIVRSKTLTLNIVP